MRTEIVNAWRAVRARPVVSAVVVGTLAVALGATTAIFSVVNGVLLRPLPYPEADRLVQLWQTNTPWLGFDNPQLRAFAVRFPLSLPTYRDWEEQLAGVESMGAYGGTSVRYGGPEYVEVLRGARVTSGFFRTLAVEPHLGRWFTSEEDAAGAPSVVVLSHETWTERFGADRDLLGRTITLDGRAHTVVGVMPPGFGFPSPGLDVWRSLSDEEKSEDRDSQFLNVIARLGDDATLVSVRSTLEAVQARLGETYPDEQAPHGEAFGGRVEPALDYLVRDVRSTLWFLLGSVALVLAVACVNIANILSVQGLSRRRELAIRASLGASRGQLVRGLLAEAALLAVMGGVLGTALAAASLPLILRALPPVIPRLGSVSIDTGVLLFGLAVTALAALVSGAFPAVQSAGVAPGQAMSEASRGVAGGRAVTRVRSALVVGEVALSFVLLVGAALLGVSYRQLVTVERGFVSEGLAFVRLEPDPDEFPEPEDRQRFVAELGRAFRSIPGVTGVSATNQAPLSGSVSSTSFTLERGDGEDAEVNVLISSVVPGYFDVMGIRVTRGRPFTEADPPGPPVAIVNESMVERFWPDEDPIGKRFRDRADDPWITVVGVVADVRHQGLGVDPEPKVYRPYPQDRRDPETWLLRTSGPPGGILAATKDAVRSVSSGTAVNRAVALDDLIDRGVAVPRMRTALVIAMAALGSFLAMLGLYGVVSYSVSQKRREIGVRMALGARAAGVVRGVVASGLFLAGTGVVIGALVAAQATSLLTGFLYAVEPLHAPTFVAAGLLVGGVSALAALLPARRAAAVDPVEVLSGD